MNLLDTLFKKVYKNTSQKTLFSVTVRHEIGEELEVISEILDDNPEVLDCVFAVLTGSQRIYGRKGLNVENDVVDCSIKAVDYAVSAIPDLEKYQNIS